MKKLKQHFNGNKLSEDDAAKLQEIATDLRRRLIEYSSRTKTPTSLRFVMHGHFDVLLLQRAEFDVAQPALGH